MVFYRAADETWELAVKDVKEHKVTYLISSPMWPPCSQVDSVSSYWWSMQKEPEWAHRVGGDALLPGLLRTQAVTLTLAIASSSAKPV